ncbi:HaeIII family restriction endonuclease [Campylobacter sp. LR264d]|uniref:HaeIII family restriction endonuclease n=1 Tax=Campylobacter sp. LR264d TaxID=2593544 RepID=UPI0039893C05
MGLSIKHNHFAVKHSRLSSKIDFGEKWYDIKCSKEYWDEIKPIFDKLQNYKNDKKIWKELKNKENEIYLPILKAFKDEIIRQEKNNISTLLVKYLIGKFDFYKMISVDKEKVTKIQSYNHLGTLNKNAKTITIPGCCFAR